MTVYLAFTFTKISIVKEVKYIKLQYVVGTAYIYMHVYLEKDIKNTISYSI